ncbi:POU domain, class 5, transcription factor 1-like [Arapaima gigas]
MCTMDQQWSKSGTAMSQEPQSPGSDYMNRYYELAKAEYPQDGSGSSQMPLPQGLPETLPEDATQFGKNAFGAVAPPHPQPQHQQVLQFLPVGTNYPYPGAEGSALGHPRPGYPLTETDYTALGVRGVGAFGAPDGGEHIVMPQVKAEEEREPELRPPYSSPSPSASVSSVAELYVHPKVQSFWPGYSRFPMVNGSPPADATSSSSESQSPPSERYPPVAPSGSGMSNARRAVAASTRSPSRSSADSEMEENICHEEMKAFAKRLKEVRVTMGFTQSDLGIALGNLSGKVFSQTTICRFEAMQLSHKNMCDLKEVLERWIVAVQMMDNPQDMCRPVQPPKTEMRTRKRRTNLDAASRSMLEHYFVVCPRPTASEITNIAKRLNLQRDVVRIWFCNRRQKGRRENMVAEEERLRVEPMQGAVPGPSSVLEQNGPGWQMFPGNNVLHLNPGPDSEFKPKPKM